MLSSWMRLCTCLQHLPNKRTESAIRIRPGWPAVANGTKHETFSDKASRNPCCEAESFAQDPDTIFQEVLRSGSDPTGYDENLLIFGPFKELTFVVFFNWKVPTLTNCTADPEGSVSFPGSGSGIHSRVSRIRIRIRIHKQS
jgi:hypothetical protein